MAILRGYRYEQRSFLHPNYSFVLLFLSNKDYINKENNGSVVNLISLIFVSFMTDLWHVQQHWSSRLETLLT
jgi:hypothetical protein